MEVVRVARAGEEVSAGRDLNRSDDLIPEVSAITEVVVAAVRLVNRENANDERWSAAYALLVEAVELVAPDVVARVRGRRPG